MTERDPKLVEELIQATLEFMAFRGSPNPATAVPYMRWRQAVARLEPNAVREAEAKLLSEEPLPSIRREALEEAMRIAQSVGASVAAGSIEALIHREDRDGASMWKTGWVTIPRVTQPRTFSALSLRITKSWQVRVAFSQNSRAPPRLGRRSAKQSSR